MRFQPTSDNVFIQQRKPEEVSPGGIYIPPTAQEKTAEGVVIAVGPGKLREDGSVIPMRMKVGAQVLFSKYGGTEIKIGGEDILIMREDQIYAASAEE